MPPETKPELSPSARAVAYALRAGDREAAERVSSALISEEPERALAHFIDAQLAFSQGEWLRLIHSARRCWALGGRAPWITLMLGGVALRCGVRSISSYLEAQSGGPIPPLSQPPEESLPDLKRALTEALPAIALPRPTDRSRWAESKPTPLTVARYQPRADASSAQDTPDWMERSLKRAPNPQRADRSEGLDWIDRSAPRAAHQTLLGTRLPEWMSVGTLEGDPQLGASLLTPAGAKSLDEGLSAGLALCEELQLPFTPRLALPLPAPTLHQAGQEPRRLLGRFLLVAYDESLGLIDLNRSAKPWHFKKSELDEIRAEQLVSQWSMSVIFSDMRVIQFEVSQGVTGSLDPYLDGGEAFKRWLAEGS